MSFFKNFLVKKMLQSQLKNVPVEQQNKIIAAVEKNPQLFTDIAAAVEAKVKAGQDQQSAAMEVMMAHQKELQDLMK